MFKNIILSYINNMSINDVIMFSKKENIILKESEYEKIYYFIKDNGLDLINNEKKVYDYLNFHFDQNKRDLIYNLFLKYKKKYSVYL